MLTNHFAAQWLQKVLSKIISKNKPNEEQANSHQEI